MSASLFDAISTFHVAKKMVDKEDCHVSDLSIVCNEPCLLSQKADKTSFPIFVPCSQLLTFDNIDSELSNGQTELIKDIFAMMLSCAKLCHMVSRELEFFSFQTISTTYYCRKTQKYLYVFKVPDCIPIAAKFVNRFLSKVDIEKILNLEVISPNKNDLTEELNKIQLSL